MENQLAEDAMQPPLLHPDQVSEIGPVELNILERIENGLNVSDREIGSECLESMQNPDDHIKFTGSKEVIAVAGWASIQAIYAQYTFDLTIRILVGAVLLLCMVYPDHALWPVALVLLFASLLQFARHALGLHSNWKGAVQLKTMHLVDLNVAAAYSILFSGLTLFFLDLIQPRTLPFFGLPLFVFALFLLFQTSDNPYVGQKRFTVVEVAQLLTIALKLGGYVTACWSYVLFVYTGAVVYVLVVGFFLLIILLCSTTGLIYQNIYRWKMRALAWMCWYYLTTGVIFLAVIKGVLQYFQDDAVAAGRLEIVYNRYHSGPAQGLIEAAVLMMALSFLNLLLHLLWEKDIRRFLAKIVYRNEVQKEIALRFLSKSFTFRLVQVSTTYFSKSPEAVQSADAPKPDQNRSTPEREPCQFCCEKDPEIVMEPCNHGGICRTCMVNYLNGKCRKCPFCKATIERVFLVETDPDRKVVTAKGQIVFRQ